jgi:hypothetical protein
LFTPVIIFGEITFLSLNHRCVTRPKRYIIINIITWCMVPSLS